jgi:hypothetical protein
MTRTTTMLLLTIALVVSLGCCSKCDDSVAPTPQSAAGAAPISAER